MTKVQRKRQLVKRFLLLLKALNDCFGDGFVNAEYISLCNEYLARYGVRTADEFKEADHPRDKDGKFAKTKGNSDWGEAFTEFSNKPKEAIKHLLSVKRGYVPNAFYRDDIGRIDLVYGNRNFGLKHIEERRKQTGQDFNRLMEDLQEIIEKGKIYKGKKENTMAIKHNHRIVIVSTLWGKQEKTKKTNWIVTAFYKL